MPKTEERDPRRKPTPEAGPSQRARSQGATPRNPTGDRRASRTETSPGTVPKLTGSLFHNEPVAPSIGTPKGAPKNGRDSTSPLLDTPHRVQAEQQFQALSKEEAALAEQQHELRQAFSGALRTPPQVQPCEGDAASAASSGSRASSESSGGRRREAQLSAMVQSLGEELAAKLQRNQEAQHRQMVQSLGQELAAQLQRNQEAQRAGWHKELELLRLDFTTQVHDLRKDLMQPQQQNQQARFQDLQKELKDVQETVSKDGKVLQDAHAIVLVHQEKITALQEGLIELREANTAQEGGLTSLQEASTEQAQQHDLLLTRLSKLEKLEHDFRCELRADSKALLARVEQLENTDLPNAAAKFEPAAAARGKKSAKTQQPYAEVVTAQARDQKLADLKSAMDELKEDLEVVKVQAQSLTSLSPSTDDFDRLKEDVQVLKAQAQSAEGQPEAFPKDVKDYVDKTFCEYQAEHFKFTQRFEAQYRDFATQIKADFAAAVAPLQAAEGAAVQARTTSRLPRGEGVLGAHQSTVDSLLAQVQQIEHSLTETSQWQAEFDQLCDWANTAESRIRRLDRQVLTLSSVSSHSRRQAHPIPKPGNSDLVQEAGPRDEPPSVNHGPTTQDFQDRDPHIQKLLEAEKGLWELEGSKLQKAIASLTARMEGVELREREYETRFDTPLQAEARTRALFEKKLQQDIVLLEEKIHARFQQQEEAGKAAMAQLEDAAYREMTEMVDGSVRLMREELGVATARYITHQQAQELIGSYSTDMFQAASKLVHQNMYTMEQRLLFEQECWHQEQSEQMAAELTPIVAELKAWRATGWLQEAIRKANGQDPAETPAVHSSPNRFNEDTHNREVHHIPRRLGYDGAAAGGTNRDDGAASGSTNRVQAVSFRQGHEGADYHQTEYEDEPYVPNDRPYGLPPSNPRGRPRPLGTQGFSWKSHQQYPPSNERYGRGREYQSRSNDRSQYQPPNEHYGRGGEYQSRSKERSHDLLMASPAAAEVPDSSLHRDRSFAARADTEPQPPQAQAYAASQAADANDYSKPTQPAQDKTSEAGAADDRLDLVGQSRAQFNDPKGGMDQRRRRSTIFEAECGEALPEPRTPADTPAGTSAARATPQTSGSEQPRPSSAMSDTGARSHSSEQARSRAVTPANELRGPRPSLALYQHPDEQPKITLGNVLGGYFDNLNPDFTRRTERDEFTDDPKLYPDRDLKMPTEEELAFYGNTATMRFVTSANRKQQGVVQFITRLQEYFQNWTVVKFSHKRRILLQCCSKETHVLEQLKAALRNGEAEAKESGRNFGWRWMRSIVLNEFAPRDWIRQTLTLWRESQVQGPRPARQWLAEFELWGSVVFLITKPRGISSEHDTTWTAPLRALIMRGGVSSVLDEELRRRVVGLCSRFHSSLVHYVFQKTSLEASN